MKGPFADAMLLLPIPFIASREEIVVDIIIFG
jgi:hypothetical protein